MTTTEETRSARRTPEEVKAGREAAAELKKKFDPWVEQLGGWEKTGIKSDLAAMAAYVVRETPDAVPAQSLASWITNWLKENNLGVQGQPAFAKLSEVFEASADVHATYIDLIRKANGAIELPEGVDWPFTIELITIDRLFADETYQRPEDDVWVRTMLIGFDERLVGTIDASDRGGGRLAIMDGRQRVAVMRLIGKLTSWATIYQGMDVPAEADFFYRKNKNRKQMHAYYAFRARALSGDSTSRLIEEIVNAAGFKLGAKQNDNETITAIRAVEDIYDFPTETSWGNSLAPALATIRKCWWGRSGALDGTLMRGLARFYSYYGAEELQTRHFEDALTALGPVLVLGRARDAKDQPLKFIGSRIDIAAATTFAEIHNAGLSRDERLNLDRIPRLPRQRAPRGGR